MLVGGVIGSGVRVGDGVWVGVLVGVGVGDGSRMIISVAVGVGVSVGTVVVVDVGIAGGGVLHDFQNSQPPNNIPDNTNSGRTIPMSRLLLIATDTSINYI